MVPMISIRPWLERYFFLLVANLRAQLRRILMTIPKGNWEKSSSMRPGGNGVVDVVLVAVVVAAEVVIEM